MHSWKQEKAKINSKVTRQLKNFPIERQVVDLLLSISQSLQQETMQEHLK